MSNTLSLIGWWFLPGLISSWVQTIWYGLTIRAGDPKPQQGTPRWVTHRRRIQILVISLYLLYTLYEADHDIRREGHFYSDLGVTPTATEREIKSRFRRLAAIYHPDKAAPDEDRSGEVFMHLKTASDTLVNPAARFAYDRFGSGVVDWKHCSTVYDYVQRGVVNGILPHYGAAAGIMYVLGLLGYLEFGRYWRWLALVVMCVFELHVVTRPRMPIVNGFVNPILGFLLQRPPYLQFQLISLARRCSVTLYIAFSQIGPLLNPQGQQERKAAEGGEEALKEGLERLDATASMLDTEADRLLSLELAPFKGDKGLAKNMQGKIKEWLVQNTVRADPMVRDAMGNSIRRRRVDAPAGAQGTK